MRPNALAIANFFVDTAKKDGSGVKPLKLMKLTYIAHGFLLAILEKSFFDSRFDKVEAWKLGPVIPSVYHSFKNWKDQEVQQKTVVLSETSFIEPVLEDEDAKKVCQFVWNRYGKRYTDSQLVDILHAEGTPWKLFYIEGQNVEIPDIYTQAYYKKLFSILVGGGTYDKK